MLASAILEIVRLSLEITLQVIKDMTPEQRAKAWERHNKHIEFFEKLFDGLEATRPTMFNTDNQLQEDTNEINPIRITAATDTHSHGVRTATDLPDVVQCGWCNHKHQCRPVDTIR